MVYKYVKKNRKSKFTKNYDIYDTYTYDFHMSHISWLLLLQVTSYTISITKNKSCEYVGPHHITELHN